MDKKSIVNDFYHASLNKCFCSWLLNVRQKDTKNEDFTRTHQLLSADPKMASVGMLIGGALANALAFTSSSYLF